MSTLQSAERSEFCPITGQLWDLRKLGGIPGKVTFGCGSEEKVTQGADGERRIDREGRARAKALC